MDPRWNFPLPWSTALPYHGVEDLAFAPGFADANSPEYHSYLFFWWIEGTKEFTAEQLQADMLMYFRGLAEERGKNYGFAPDLSRVSTEYRISGGPRQTPVFLSRDAIEVVFNNLLPSRKSVAATHGEEDYDRSDERSHWTAARCGVSGISLFALSAGPR